MNYYKFKQPLIRGTLLKRNSQFTATVDINGEQLIAHIPTTKRIGDVETKDLPCLLLYHSYSTRKLKYSVETVLLTDDNWIGINQILSNRLAEFFIKKHALDEIVPFDGNIQREVTLGTSKLDFKVGDTYLEVKTSLTTLNAQYDANVKTIPQKPFSSTDRLVKHVNQLAESLETQEKAVFIQVFQYVVTQHKERLCSTNYKEVLEYIKSAVQKGVDFWELQMKFSESGVALHSIKKTDFKFKD